MATRDSGRRGPGHEDPGSVDYPWDDDRPASHELVESDATCSFAWPHDGFEALSVFIDPALGDRAGDICRTIEAILGNHGDIDTLTDAIQTFADGEQLSASIYERPPDALTSNLVAVALTLG